MSMTDLMESQYAYMAYMLVTMTDTEKEELTISCCLSGFLRLRRFVSTFGAEADEW